MIDFKTQVCLGQNKLMSLFLMFDLNCCAYTALVGSEEFVIVSKLDFTLLSEWQSLRYGAAI